MNDERFLITGALGCIGAWIVKRLLAEGEQVWTYDLGGDPHRLRLILSDAALGRVHFVTGDILDAGHLEQVVVEERITHILHLAALQVPLVRANPALGAQVNLVGMAHILEAARKHAGQVVGLAYASSAAVYGPPQLYPPGPVNEETPLRPDTLYGVHKQANEGMARVYWQDFGLRSVGLRPYVVYGPGRDQGITAGPTKAMLAAAASRPYRISFGSGVMLQHANDTAAAFVQAARAGKQGAFVYNLGGCAATPATIVEAIAAYVPEAAGSLAYMDTALPFPPQIDGGLFDRDIGGVDWVPLPEGVAQTVDDFRKALADGRIDLNQALA